MQYLVHDRQSKNIRQGRKKNKQHQRKHVPKRFPENEMLHPSDFQFPAPAIVEVWFTLTPIRIFSLISFFRMLKSAFPNSNTIIKHYFLDFGFG